MKQLLPLLTLCLFLAACSKEGAPEPEMVNISFQNFENLSASASKMLIVVTSIENEFVESFEVRPGKKIVSEEQYPSNKPINIHLLITDEDIEVNSFLGLYPKDYIYYSLPYSGNSVGDITINNAEQPDYDNFLTSSIGSSYITRTRSSKLMEGQERVYVHNDNYLLNSWDYNGVVYFDLNGPLNVGDVITTHAASNAQATSFTLNASLNFNGGVQAIRSPLIGQNLMTGGQQVRLFYGCVPENPAMQKFKIARMPYKNSVNKISLYTSLDVDQYPEHNFSNYYHQIDSDVTIDQYGSIILPNHSFDTQKKQILFSFESKPDYVSTSTGYYNYNAEKSWRWYATGSAESTFVYPIFPESFREQNPEFIFPTDKLAEMEYSIGTGDYSCFNGYADYQHNLFTRTERGPIQEDYYFLLRSSVSASVSSVGGRQEIGSTGIPKDYFDY